MNKIDDSLRTPKYMQLMKILIHDIENYMNENDKLDSEREICEKYGVSRTTVRQALDELEKNKYIYKIQGKGNFISSKEAKQDLINFYSFTDEMKKLGRVPKSELIGFEIMEANDKTARKLAINKKELVYKISRIIIADDIPMMFEVTYLPYEKFKGLKKEMLMKKSIYSIFKDEFNISMKLAEETFEAIVINKLESIYLGINEGAPGLKIERITYENKEIVEYTVSIARGDKFKYKVTLNN